MEGKDMELNYKAGKRHYINAVNGAVMACNRDIYNLLKENGIKKLHFNQRDVFGLNAVFCDEESDAIGFDDYEFVHEEKVSSVEMLEDDGIVTVNGVNRYGYIREDGSVNGFYPENVSPWLYFYICEIIESGEFLEDEK